MIAYECPLSPPCNYWQEYGKPKFIEEMIKDICKNINKHPACLDLLYEYVEENIERYLPEESYE